MQNDDESDDHRKNRFDFYQGGFRWVAAILLVMAVWAAGDVWKDVYVLMHPPAPTVIGLEPDGSLQKALVLDKPIIGDVEMKQWAVNAVEKTCNLNFMDWQKQLNDASDNFLPAAVNGLVAEMESKNIIKELQSDRLLQWCHVGAAAITTKAVVNGALYYEIKMPVDILYKGQNEFANRLSREMMRVVVLQVDRSVKPRGFGIASLQAAPDKAPVDGVR